MSSAKPDPRERVSTAASVAPSSWWPFVALALGAVGSYGLLLVHLLLEATHASAWGLAWMAIPALFFGGSATALLIASGMPLGEKVAAIPASLLGYSPRASSNRRTATGVRGPA